MVYILMSVIATFLALCYGMLVFIGIFYCVMSETIRNKIRHRGGDKPLAPESITQEAIMAGKVTASQLLNAGMITPSALQNMTSKASKIGPDYSSGIRGSRVDGPGNALASRTTGSRVQDEGKSKMGSAIRSQVGSRKSAVVGSKVGSHISKKE